MAWQEKTALGDVAQLCQGSLEAANEAAPFAATSLLCWPAQMWHEKQTPAAMSVDASRRHPARKFRAR